MDNLIDTNNPMTPNNEYLLAGRGNIDATTGVDLDGYEYASRFLRGEAGYGIPQDQNAQRYLGSLLTKLFFGKTVKSCADSQPLFKIVQMTDRTGLDKTPKTEAERLAMIKEMYDTEEMVAKYAEQYSVPIEQALKEIGRNTLLESRGIDKNRYVAASNREKYEMLNSAGVGKDALGMERNGVSKAIGDIVLGGINSARSMANAANGVPVANVIDDYTVTTEAKDMKVSANMRGDVRQAMRANNNPYDTTASGAKYVADWDWRDFNADSTVDSEAVKLAVTGMKPREGVATDKHDEESDDEYLARKIWEISKGDPNGVYVSKEGDAFIATPYKSDTGEVKYKLQIANGGATERYAKLVDEQEREENNLSLMLKAVETFAYLSGDPKLEAMYYEFCKGNEDDVKENLVRSMAQAAGTDKEAEEFERAQTLMYLLNMRNRRIGITHSDTSIGAVMGLGANLLNSIGSVGYGVGSVVTKSPRGFVKAWHAIEEMCGKSISEQEMYERWVDDAFDYLTSTEFYSYDTAVGDLAEFAGTLYGYGALQRVTRATSVARGLSSVLVAGARLGNYNKGVSKALVKAAVKLQRQASKVSGGRALSGFRAYNGKITDSSKKWLEAKGYKKFADGVYAKPIYTNIEPKLLQKVRLKQKQIDKEFRNTMKNASKIGPDEIAAARDKYLQQCEELVNSIGWKWANFAQDIRVLADELPMTAMMFLSGMEERRSQDAFTIGQEMDSFSPEMLKSANKYQLYGSGGTALLMSGAIKAVQSKSIPVQKAATQIGKLIEAGDIEGLAIVEDAMANALTANGIHTVLAAIEKDTLVGGAMSVGGGYLDMAKQQAVAKAKDPNYEPTFDDYVANGEQIGEWLAETGKFALAGGIGAAPGAIGRTTASKREVKGIVNAEHSRVAPRRAHLAKMAIMSGLRDGSRRASSRETVMRAREAYDTIVSAYREAFAKDGGRGFDGPAYLEVRKRYAEQYGEAAMRQIDMMFSDPAMKAIIRREMMHLDDGHREANIYANMAKSIYREEALNALKARMAGRELNEWNDDSVLTAIGEVLGLKVRRDKDSGRLEFTVRGKNGKAKKLYSLYENKEVNPDTGRVNENGEKIYESGFASEFIDFLMSGERGSLGGEFRKLRDEVKSLKSGLERLKKGDDVSGILTRGLNALRAVNGLAGRYDANGNRIVVDESFVRERVKGGKGKMFGASEGLTTLPHEVVHALIDQYVKQGLMTDGQRRKLLDAYNGENDAAKEEALVIDVVEHGLNNVAGKFIGEKLAEDFGSPSALARALAGIKSGFMRAMQALGLKEEADVKENIFELFAKKRTEEAEEAKKKEETKKQEAANSKEAMEALETITEGKEVKDAEGIEGEVGEEVKAEEPERKKYEFLGTLGATPKELKVLEGAKDAIRDAIKEADKRGLFGTKREKFIEKKREDVFRKTHWWYGPDGNWRIEVFGIKPSAKFNGIWEEWKQLWGDNPLTIDDAEVSGADKILKATKLMARAGKMRVSEVFPELAKRYSILDDYTVKFDMTNDKAIGGKFDPLNSEITIYQFAPDNVIHHEVQHLIQSIEGFSQGTNPDTVSYLRNSSYRFSSTARRVAVAAGAGGEYAKQNHALYENTTGEVEAEFARVRMEMSDAERKRIPPWKTYKYMQDRYGRYLTPKARGMFAAREKRISARITEATQTLFEALYYDVAKRIADERLQNEYIDHLIEGWPTSESRGKKRYADEDDVPTNNAETNTLSVPEIEAYTRGIIGDNRADRLSELAKEEVLRNGVGKPKYDLRAESQSKYEIGGIYTGSAADYAHRREDGTIENGPSLRYVGKGEGNQVYGWGLYASSRRNIARSYARKDVRDKRHGKMTGNVFSGFSFEGRRDSSKLLHNGKEVNTPYDRDNIKSVVESLMRRCTPEEFRRDLERLKEDDYPGVWEEWIAEGLFGNWEEYDGDPEDFNKGIKEGLDYLREHGDEYTLVDISPKEQIYSQTFFTNRASGDESHLLNWYEPVSDENIVRIKQGLEKENVKEKAGRFQGPTLFQDPTTLDWIIEYTKDWFTSRVSLGDKPTGGEIYDALSHYFFSSPREVSEFLARSDIDGVKFPARSYNRDTPLDGNKVGWNYVSFRDDNIRVDHKWVNGKQKYEIIGDSGLDRLTGGPDVRNAIVKAIREKLEIGDESPVVTSTKAGDIVSIVSAVGNKRIHFYDATTKVKPPTKLIDKALKGEKMTVATFFDDKVLKKAHPRVYNAPVYFADKNEMLAPKLPQETKDLVMRTMREGSDVATAFDYGGDKFVVINVEKLDEAKNTDKKNWSSKILTPSFKNAIADLVRKESPSDVDENTLTDATAKTEAIYDKGGRNADKRSNSNLTYWLTDPRLASDISKDSVISLTIDNFMRYNGIAVDGKDELVQKVKDVIREEIHNSIGHFATRLETKQLGKSFGMKAEDAAKAYQENAELIGGGMTPIGSPFKTTAEKTKAVLNFYSDVALKAADALIFGAKTRGTRKDNSLSPFFDEVVTTKLFNDTIANILRGTRAAWTTKQQEATGLEYGERIEGNVGSGNSGTISVSVDGNIETVEGAVAMGGGIGEGAKIDMEKVTRNINEDSKWQSSRDRVVGEVSTEVIGIMRSLIAEAGGRIQNVDTEKVEGKMKDRIAEIVKANADTTDADTLKVMGEYVKQRVASMFEKQKESKYEILGSPEDRITERISAAAGALWLDRFARDKSNGRKLANTDAKVREFVVKALRDTGLPVTDENIRGIILDARDAAGRTLHELSEGKLSMEEIADFLSGSVSASRVSRFFFDAFSGGNNNAEVSNREYNKAIQIADRAKKRQIDDATGIPIHQIISNVGFDALADLDKIGELEGMESPERFAQRFISGFFASGLGIDGAKIHQRSGKEFVFRASDLAKDPLTRHELALTISSWLRAIATKMLYGRARESAMRDAEHVMAKDMTIAAMQNIVAHAAWVVGRYQRINKVSNLIHGFTEKYIDADGKEHSRKHDGILDVIDRVAKAGQMTVANMPATQRDIAPLLQDYWKQVKDAIQMKRVAVDKRIALIEEYFKARDEGADETKLEEILKGEDGTISEQRLLSELKALKMYGAMRDMKYAEARDLIEGVLLKDLYGNAKEWAAKMHARRTEIAADRKAMLDALNRQVRKDLEKGKDYTRKDSKARNFLINNIPNMFERLRLYINRDTNLAADDVVSKIRREYSLAHMKMARFTHEFEASMRTAFKRIYGESFESMLPELMRKRAEYSRFSRSGFEIDKDEGMIPDYWGEGTEGGKSAAERAEATALSSTALSKANLMYIYAAMRQADMAENNRIYRRGNDYLKDLEGELTAQDKAFVNWLVEAYDAMRERISEVSQDVSGLPVMSPGAFYHPLVFAQAHQSRDISKYRTSIFPGFLTERVNHDRAKLDEQADVFKIFENRVQDAGHYLAFAKLTDYMNQTVKSADVQHAFYKILGNTAKNELYSQIADSLNGGRLDAKGCLGGLRNLSNAFSLFFNPISALKQFEGIAGWAAAYGLMPTVRAIALRGTFVFDAKTRQGTRELMEAGLFSTRRDEGFSEAMAAVLDAAADIEGKSGAMGKRLVDLYRKNGMAFTVLIDHLSTRMCAGNFYMGRKEMYIKNGYAESLAKQMALADVDYMVQISQQSGRQEFRHRAQRGEVFGRVMSQFAGPSLVRLGEELAEAHRAFALGETGAFKKLASKVLALHVACPALLTAITSMTQYLFSGQDDDEIKEQFQKNLAISCLLGPLSGWFIFGQVVNAAAHTAIMPDVKTLTNRTGTIPAIGKLMNVSRSTAKIASEVIPAIGGEHCDMDEVREESLKLIEALFPMVRAGVGIYERTQEGW